MEAVEVSSDHEPWDIDTFRDVVSWIKEEQRKIRERFNDYVEISGINFYNNGEISVMLKDEESKFGGTAFSIGTKTIIKYKYYTVTDISLEISGRVPIYVDIAKTFDIYTDNESFAFILFYDPENEAKSLLRKILRYDIEE